MAAEVEGVLQLLRALDAADREGEGMIIVNNLHTVRGTRGGRLDGTRPAMWQEIWRLRRRRRGYEISWAPAHDRHLEWEAPAGQDSMLWRAVNCCADVAANARATATHEGKAPERRAKEAVVADTEKAIALQIHAPSLHWELHETGPAANID